MADSNQPRARERRDAAPLKRVSGEVLVLIVDDDATVRAHVDKMLRIAGYITMAAENGPAALRRVTGVARLDLLVTDLLMPGMNGDELTTHLRHTYRQLPVVYLTGFRDQLFRDRGPLWHNERLLEKPCTMQELLEAMDSLLSGQTGVPGEH